MITLHDVLFTSFELSSLMLFVGSGTDKPTSNQQFLKACNPLKSLFTLSLNNVYHHSTCTKTVLALLIFYHWLRFISRVLQACPYCYCSTIVERDFTSFFLGFEFQGDADLARVSEPGHSCHSFTHWADLSGAWWRVFSFRDGKPSSLQ